MTAERRLKLETGAREDDERDDTSRGTPGGGLMRGWGRHLHGYTCPRCGAGCTGKDIHARRVARLRHDSWHQDDDQAWDEWTEEMTEMKAELVKFRGQLELFTELLGPALARVMDEREPA